MNDIPQSKSKRSRLTLIILVIMFALPIVFAWIATKNKSWQPTSGKNYGELVQPARPLPEFSLRKLDGTDFKLEDMRRKWSYVYFVTQTCEQHCQESLVKVRDARLALSGDALRVQYFLIYAQKPDAAEVAKFAKEHPRLIVLQAEGENVTALLNTFKLPGDESLVAAQRVYLVDPIGNFMMYYPESFPGNGLLKDIRYLLHWSQIG
jgi:cytochrome oxidase Cu insertion factor (SCO1/SenC/PrrC family)